jgi:imidazole glycerol phosphate synthase glutamine amidotransferase subunit
LKAAVADYGVGNLHSISKALERAGADVRVVSDPRQLVGSECLVFPGVGAFGAAMEILRPASFELKGMMAEGTPVLGICLGMQVLFERSEESPGGGLSVILGDVRKLRAERIPHMGWNTVEFSDDPLFEGIPVGSRFYFANSYVCVPNEDVETATTDYGQRFTSSVRKGRVCGVQFHPEKSGPQGLRVLENFVKMVEGTR